MATKKPKKNNKLEALNDRTARLLGAVMLGAQTPDGKYRPEVAAALDFISKQKGAAADECKFIIDRLMMAAASSEEVADMHGRTALALRTFADTLIDHLVAVRRNKTWKHGKGTTWRVDAVPRNYSAKFTVNKKSGAK